MPDTRVLLQSGLVRVNHVRRGGLNVRSKGFFFKNVIGVWLRLVAKTVHASSATCQVYKVNSNQIFTQFLKIRYPSLKKNKQTIKNVTAFDYAFSTNWRYNVSCNIRLSLWFCLFVVVEMYFVVILSVFCYFHVFTQCSIKYFLVVTISCFFL